VISKGRPVGNGTFLDMELVAPSFRLRLSLIATRFSPDAEREMQRLSLSFSSDEIEGENAKLRTKTPLK